MASSSAGESAALLLGPGTDGGGMHIPVQRAPPSREERFIRAGSLGAFGCVYTGVCTWVLSSARHVPSMWDASRGTLRNFGDALCVLGALVALGVAAVMLTKPELRPRCDRTGFWKPARLAGHLWRGAVVAGLVTMPYIVWFIFDEKKLKPHSTAWLVAGTFTALACGYTVREVMGHLANYRIPVLQRNIIRILWIVPVYSLACWLGLRFLQERVYFGVVRELYEALVVYSFMRMMTDFMDSLARSEGTNTVALLGTQPAAHHMFPVSLLAKCGLVDEAPAMVSADGRSSPFLFETKLGVLQYVPISIFCALLSAALELCGWLHEGRMQGMFTHGWVYLVVIRNVSQFWALYSLVMFYHGTAKLLAPISPFAKFLSIKLVIFATFWQKIIIVFAKHEDLLPLDNIYGNWYQNRTDSGWGDPVESKEEFDELAAVGIQNILICFEMFLAAVAHRHVFSHKDFRPQPQGGDESQSGRGTLAFSSALGHIFQVDDVAGEVEGWTKNKVATVLQSGRLPQPEREPEPEPESGGGGGGGGRIDDEDVEVGTF
jgi:hypothetical protein